MKVTVQPLTFQNSSKNNKHQSKYQNKEKAKLNTQRRCDYHYGKYNLFGELYGNI